MPPAFNEHLILTWGRPALWREANQTLNYLVATHGERFARASMIAHKIRAYQERLHGLMDDLCLRTCPWCPDPCCLQARVWIDFRDLIYLHLGGLPKPGEQLFYADDSTCRYLGGKGCRLPRKSRPWACTRYLCPTHNNIIHQKGDVFRTSLEKSIQSVKNGRKRLEAEFMRVILP